VQCAKSLRAREGKEIWSGKKEFSNRIDWEEKRTVELKPVKILDQWRPIPSAVGGGRTPDRIKWARKTTAGEEEEAYIGNADEKSKLTIGVKRKIGDNCLPSDCRDVNDCSRGSLGTSHREGVQKEGIEDGI